MGLLSLNQPGGQQPNYGAMAGNIVSGGQQAGFFSPMGSPAIMRATRRGALRTAENAKRRSALLARLMGLDPNQARVAQVNQETQSSGDIAGALDESQQNQLLGNQQYARGVFGNQLGFSQQKQLADEAAKRAERQQMLGTIGQLGGAAIGSFLGPAGTAIGAKVGKRAASYYDSGAYQGFDPYGYRGR